MEAKTSLDLISADGWFSERNSQWPGVANSLKCKKVLFYKHSKFQEVMIFESETQGNVLILDGVIQLTDRFEFIYHEMMSHVPLFSHPNPMNILVIGAGDGGVVRELCKHSSVKKIVWIEIDEDVVIYSKKYFPQIAASNDDPRVDLKIMDGYRYVRESNDNTFDIIICDSSDPIGPAKMLFTKQFYSDCHRILKPGGILCSQSECIFQNAKLITDLVENSKKVFENGRVNYGSMFIPMYPFGQIGCLICRKYCPELEKKNMLDVTRPVRNIPNDMLQTFRYYSKSIHSSCFSLPRFIGSKL